MASTEVGADEASLGRYPVDEIKDKTHCELHQSMKNISMKVAVSYALSCEPGVRGIPVRFQMAMLVSGWMKLYPEMSH
jgi:hypothetical protein